MGPVPVVLLLFAMAFAWLYPISREHHRALLDELAEKV
jgi:Na+/melibiose symporter-like transporter